MYVCVLYIYIYIDIVMTFSSPIFFHTKNFPGVFAMQFFQIFGLLCIPRITCFCPKGFGPGTFPAEYKIPSWPEDMSWEDSAKLRTITLGGFKQTLLNEEYLEGPNSEFLMQGRETFWQASGQYFMYYCQRFRKWRIAEISAFSQNMQGQCFAFVSDAHPNRDILNETMLKGFIEVEDGEWASRKEAGVTALGVLGDQMDLGEESTDTADSEACAAENSADSTDSKTSKCPVMPVVRKARDKAVQVVKEAGKWARRLFPRYLGAPEEEDMADMDVENPLFARENGACVVKALKGCSFKEQFFIEKQQARTLDEQQAELQRLLRMENVVMKPAQTAWVAARIEILKQLVETTMQ